MCRNKDRDVLQEEERILKRWAQNFEQLLKTEAAPVNNEIELGGRRKRNYEDQSANSKKNKAPSVDEILVELIKEGLGALRNHIFAR